MCCDSVVSLYPLHLFLAVVLPVYLGFINRQLVVKSASFTSCTNLLRNYYTVWQGKSANILLTKPLITIEGIEDEGLTTQM